MLSNKLTFSLAFIVMLALGLGLMALPADAGKYTATFASSAWTVNLMFPAMEGDVELGTGGLEAPSPKIEADSTDTDDGLDGMTATNVTAGSSTVAVTFLQTDGTTAATRVGNTAFVNYEVGLAPTNTDDGGTTDVDEGAVSFTVDGYTTVTLSTDDQATGHTETALSMPSDEAGNIIEFTLDASVSRFHIIYDEAADTDATAERLSNGIRLGTGYVDAAATTAATLPDLASFFSRGGTIKVLDDGNATAVTSGVWITEVMWGHDAMSGVGTPSSDNQWIEVYYQVGEMDDTTPDPVDLKLQFVYNAYDAGGIDEVSNLYLAKWNPKGQSGRSGYSQVDGSAPIPVISMYRKRGLTVTATGSMYNKTAKFEANGAYPGSWDASDAALNMDGAFIGTPGSAHLVPTIGGGHADYAKSEVPGTPLQFSEVRNDGSGNNVDWIEIRNVSDAAVNLKDYEISLVTGVSSSDLLGKWDARGRENRRWANLDANKKATLEHELAIVGEDKYYDQVNNDVKKFPDWMLPAGAYLLITNQDPSDTILAGGQNIEILADQNIDDKTTNKGSGVYYFVTEHLRFANKGTTAAPLLVMRKRLDRNEYHGKVHGDGASIVDLAGSGRFASTSPLFNTEVWPLKGWKNPGGSPNISAAGVWNFVKDGNHEWWKTDGVKSPGVGYDKNADPRLAVGTPGYPNGVVKDKLVDKKGTSDTSDDVRLLNGDISISEIMFDASVHAGNERWNLVQWIELYNSSMTEAINLKDWEFIIQNSDDHVDSFVDSSFRFNDLIIHPNQTVLLVSARAANAGIAGAQIYNLYTQHARVLGLANRRANLLSPAGFYLKLIDKNNDLVDEAGNVSVNGRQRSTADWEAIPPSEGPVRYSLIRQYGTREEDGDGPDLPAVGTMEEAWIVADLDGEGATFYGQRGDVATPGFRQGGPLPVSLSSFRPVRNEDTGHVAIRWITQSELNNAGFNILRSETKKGEFKVVNVKGIIPGHGTTSEKHVYEWTDTTAKPNVVYYYQIEDVSLDGNRTLLTTTRLKGHVSAAGKLTTTWGDLKDRN